MDFDRAIEVLLEDKIDFDLDEERKRTIREKNRPSSSSIYSTPKKNPILWNFFSPPMKVKSQRVLHIPQSTKGLVRKGSSEFIKPSLEQQFKLVSMKLWKDWSLVKDYDGGKGPKEMNKMNLFEEIFSPTMFLHNRSHVEGLEDVFKYFHDIHFLSKEKLQEFERTCTDMKEKMKQTKIEALKKLEAIIDGQIDKFDQEVLQKITEQRSGVEKIDSKKMRTEGSEIMDITVTEKTPLTDIILKCSDSMIIIFSFLETKEILRGISVSSSFFYHYVKKNIPISVRIKPKLLNHCPLDILLDGYRVKELLFGNRVFFWHTMHAGTDGERLIDIIKSNRNHLKRVELYDLDRCCVRIKEDDQLDLLGSKFENKFSKQVRSKRVSEIMKIRIDRLFHHYDCINDTLRLETLFVTILPSRMNNLRYLKKLVYPIAYHHYFFTQLKDPPKKTAHGGHVHEKVDTKRGKRTIEDVDTLIRYFSSPRPYLKELLFFDPKGIIDYITNDRVYSSPNEYITKTDKLRLLNDCISKNCPNLDRFYTRMFFAFRSFSKEFMEYVSKINRVKLLYSEIDLDPSYEYPGIDFDHQYDSQQYWNLGWYDDSDEWVEHNKFLRIKKRNRIEKIKNKKETEEKKAKEESAKKEKEKLEKIEKLEKEKKNSKEPVIDPITTEEQNEATKKKDEEMDDSQVDSTAKKDEKEEKETTKQSMDKNVQNDGPSSSTSTVVTNESNIAPLDQQQLGKEKEETEEGSEEQAVKDDLSWIYKVHYIGESLPSLSIISEENYNRARINMTSRILHFSNLLLKNRFASKHDDNNYYFMIINEDEFEYQLISMMQHDPLSEPEKHKVQLKKEFLKSKLQLPHITYRSKLRMDNSTIFNPQENNNNQNTRNHNNDNENNEEQRVQPNMIPQDLNSSYLLDLLRSLETVGCDCLSIDGEFSNQDTYYSDLYSGKEVDRMRGISHPKDTLYKCLLSDRPGLRRLEFRFVYRDRGSYLVQHQDDDEPDNGSPHPIPETTDLVERERMRRERARRRRNQRRRKDSEKLTIRQMVDKKMCWFPKMLFGSISENLGQHNVHSLSLSFVFTEECWCRLVDLKNFLEDDVVPFMSVFGGNKSSGKSSGDLGFGIDDHRSFHLKIWVTSLLSEGLIQLQEKEKEESKKREKMEEEEVEGEEEHDTHAHDDDDDEKQVEEYEEEHRKLEESIQEFEMELEKEVEKFVQEVKDRFHVLLYENEDTHCWKEFSLQILMRYNHKDRKTKKIHIHYKK